MAEAKAIRITEYSISARPPLVFSQQAHNIFWEEFNGWQIFTKFSRDLARDYIPTYALIPESKYRNPQDVYLDFKGLDYTIYRTEQQLAWILYALGGDISSKQILDLGCGSTGGTKDSETEYDLHLYQPWLCRTLLKLGAAPIGVDIGNLEGERFQTYHRDLTLPNSLDFLTDNTIDVVHSRALFSSPHMNVSENNLMSVLRQQIERVLKSNGALVYSKNW